MAAPLWVVNTQRSDDVSGAMKRPYFVHANVLYSPGRAEPMAHFLPPHGPHVRGDLLEYIALLLNYDRHEVSSCAVCGTVFFGNSGLENSGAGYTQAEYAILQGWRRRDGQWRCPKADCQKKDALTPHAEDETGTCPHCYPYRCQCSTFRPEQCTAEHGATRTGCLLPRGHVTNHRNLLFVWPEHESAPSREAKLDEAVCLRSERG